MSTALALAWKDVALIEPADLFPRTEGAKVRNLLDEHAELRAQLGRFAEFATAERCTPTFGYFLRGNTDPDNRGAYFGWSEKLFGLDGAARALDADFWQRALLLTDVYQVMNQDRRTKWDESIKKLEVPPFTAANLSETLGDLLASRDKFFAERVDGVFRVLSGEHVTNQPQGFGKRMILAYVVNEWGHADARRTGYISDLRAVVAKFMGREEPAWHTSSRLVEIARERHGEWTDVDGGAIRMRVYLKGTAHLEIHPEMAWRLNAVLHTLYPRAIAAEFRKRPNARSKTWAAIQRPLPAEVLSMLSTMRRRDDGTCELERWRHSESSKVYEEAVRTLEYIGGVVDDRGDARFSYDSRPVVNELLTRGCLPDRVTHQFYPTPENVRDVALSMAEIGEGHDVLEPSAGTGSIAEALPKDRTTCVELSALHAAVLQAKGFATVVGDFLTWSPRCAFDRVVMNPPYSEGRWLAHLEAAAKLVANAGRLVAVLPASAQHREGLLVGWSLQWSDVLVNEFAGTSVSVVVLAATRRGG